MSLYSDFLNETNIKKIVELDSGFATYFIHGPECYIDDLYVDPNHRRSGIGTCLADKVADIAKQSGCKYLITTVNTKINDPTRSIITVLVGYDFKFLRSTEQMLFFKKDLQ